MCVRIMVVFQVPVTHIFLNRFSSGGGEGVDEEERHIYIYIRERERHTHIYISLNTIDTRHTHVNTAEMAKCTRIARSALLTEIVRGNTRGRDAT